MIFSHLMHNKNNRAPLVVDKKHKPDISVVATDFNFSDFSYLGASL